MVVLAVLFTATVTPFEVAFLKTAINALFVLNRIIDFIFLIVRARVGPATPCRRPWCLH